MALNPQVTASAAFRRRPGPELLTGDPLTLLAFIRQAMEDANADETGPDGDASLLHVPTRTANLPVGDYSIFGLPFTVIERKSKDDLYSSMSTRAKRENFKARLAEMSSSYPWSAVVIESDWADILGNPPAFTEYRPKAVWRSVASWMQRWPSWRVARAW